MSRRIWKVKDKRNINNENSGKEKPKINDISKYNDKDIIMDADLSKIEILSLIADHCDDDDFYKSPDKMVRLFHLLDTGYMELGLNPCVKDKRLHIKIGEDTVIFNYRRSSAEYFMGLLILFQINMESDKLFTSEVDIGAFLSTMDWKLMDDDNSFLFANHNNFMVLYDEIQNSATRLKERLKNSKIIYNSGIPYEPRTTFGFKPKGFSDPPYQPINKSLVSGKAGLEVNDEMKMNDDNNNMNDSFLVNINDIINSFNVLMITQEKQLKDLSIEVSVLNSYKSSVKIKEDKYYGAIRKVVNTGINVDRLNSNREITLKTVNNFSNMVDEHIMPQSSMFDSLENKIKRTPFKE